MTLIKKINKHGSVEKICVSAFAHMLCIVKLHWKLSPNQTDDH